MRTTFDILFHLLSCFQILGSSFPSDRSYDLRNLCFLKTLDSVKARNNFQCHLFYFPTEAFLRTSYVSSMQPAELFKKQENTCDVLSVVSSM